ncbi:MAG: 16S rRNA (uracil(1498)-N(3))-methyltransferase [Bacteroidales bacterium]|nr:16S rRNA (uracil(1498)-N(3))-methyltransferase [Bacteroidales bacterium]
MEIFYTNMVDGREARLDAEESTHAVKVLRHRRGDEIAVVDGFGNMFHCRLTDDSPKGAVAEILEKVPGWGAHPYSLNMAVCPTKNIDRFEWFCEKATELGVDVITPIIGERSERRVFKPERCRKIVLSAMKQSLKAKLPTVLDAVPLKDFLSQDVPGLKLICYCFEGDARRESITDVLNEYATGFNGIDSADATGATGHIGSSDAASDASAAAANDASADAANAAAASDASAAAGTTAGHCPETLDEPKITILIGPEGDFSPEEANLAVSQGYIPVHLGPSRLRTETAAVTAVTATYLHFAKL